MSSNVFQARLGRKRWPTTFTKLSTFLSLKVIAALCVCMCVSIMYHKQHAVEGQSTHLKQSHSPKAINRKEFLQQLKLPFCVCACESKWCWLQNIYKASIFFATTSSPFLSLEGIFLEPLCFNHFLDFFFYCNVES